MCVVLEKDGEDQLDQLCEELRSEQRVKEERNNLQTIKKRHAEWIGHILHTNYLSQQVIERKIDRRTEVMGRRGRRHKQLLDDLKAKKQY